MSRYTKRPNIPGLSKLSKEIREVLAPVKQLLDIHEGRTGNPTMDPFVKKGELDDVRKTASITTRPDDGNAPDPPTNVEVVAGVFSNRISWTNATNDDLWAVEVFVSLSGDWTEAEHVATVTIPQDRRGKSSQYIHHPSAPSADHYYWVRSVDYAGNASRLAPIKESPLFADGNDTIGETIDKILDALEAPNAPAWSSDALYEAGQIVRHDEKLWQCYLAVVIPGIEPGTEIGTNYWRRTGLILQGDMDGQPTVGINGNLVVKDTVLARAIAAGQIELGHIATDSTAALVNKYAPGKGIGQNVNDWSVTVSGNSANQYLIKVAIDKANNRMLIEADADWGTSGMMTYAYELEVYGTSVSSAPGADSHSSSTVVNSGTVAAGRSDPITISFYKVDETVAFSIKITEFYVGNTEEPPEEPSEKRAITMGDRFVSHNPDIPYEAYFAPIDSEEYDVLRMTNSASPDGSNETWMNNLQALADNKVSVYVSDSSDPPSWSDADSNHYKDEWYQSDTKTWFEYTMGGWVKTDESLFELSELADNKVSIHVCASTSPPSWSDQDSNHYGDEWYQTDTKKWFEYMARGWTEKDDGIRKIEQMADNKISIHVSASADVPSWSDGDENHYGDEWYQTDTKTWMEYTVGGWEEKDTGLFELEQLAGEKTTVHYRISEPPDSLGRNGDFCIVHDGDSRIHYRKIWGQWYVSSEFANGADVTAYSRAKDVANLPDAPESGKPFVANGSYLGYYDYVHDRWANYLAGDGSGSFANGNIAWDTDGNAYFSGRVTVGTGSNVEPGADNTQGAISSTDISDALVNGNTIIDHGVIRTDYLLVKAVNIEEAAIKAAHIEELSVDTLHIKDNATGFFEGADNDSEITDISPGFWKSVVWDTIWLDGTYPIQIFATVVVDSDHGSAQTIDAKLERDGTFLTSVAQEVSAQASAQFVLAYNEIVPSGTHTYSLRVKSPESGTDIIRSSIMLTVFKK